jgi:hypothetical protein
MDQIQIQEAAAQVYRLPLLQRRLVLEQAVATTLAVVAVVLTIH